MEYEVVFWCPFGIHLDTLAVEPSWAGLTKHPPNILARRFQALFSVNVAKRRHFALFRSHDGPLECKGSRFPSQEVFCPQKGSHFQALDLRLGGRMEDLNHFHRLVWFRNNASSLFWILTCVGNYKFRFVFVVLTVNGFTLPLHNLYLRMQK